MEKIRTRDKHPGSATLDTYTGLLGLGRLVPALLLLLLLGENLLLAQPTVYTHRVGPPSSQHLAATGRDYRRMDWSY
jgi:hypothetical protein